MSTRRYLATKISPTILIGEDIEFSTRNFKTSKKPPSKSIDCNDRFKKYVTDDNTDALLNETYTGSKCTDIIGINYDDLTLPEYTILLKKGDKINAKRIHVESINHNLEKEAKVINKTGTHKATSYNIKELTICSIKQEELNIFNNKNFDRLKALKLSGNITNDGYIEIDI
jgi:hypothetical protein